ncbi:MAG: class I SAM-dependent methyltransferase [Bacilli bacterium]|jgi:tRNA (adenine22-N1)-methyltransferase
MISLSKRLLTIASFVERDKIVDIGCDHALLDIYLIEQNPNRKIIAADIKQGALKQAAKNIAKYNLTNSIDLRLSDGLSKIEADEINTIIMSGLGCPKIVDILNHGKDKLTDDSDIIIQSNTDYYDLRKAVCSLGYFIANEKLVKENNIIYLIIHFQRGKVKYTNNDYLWGPFLRLEKSSLYRELLTNDLKKKENLYSLIPNKYILKKFKLKGEIFKLRRTLK